MRFTALFAVAALCLGGCGGPQDPVQTDLDQAAARIAKVQQDMAEVATAQAQAGPGLPEALDAIRLVDELVPLLVEGETFDDGLARVAAVGNALDQVDLADARPTTRDVAFAVDRARVSLRRAQDVLDVPEDVAYLEATDVVLQEVRDYAMSQDALAQVLERHLPVYRELHDLAVDFQERRSRFRSADEAADAFSVEARELLRLVAAAQDDLAEFVAARDRAATAVNQAQEAAAAAFRSRDDAA